MIEAIHDLEQQLATHVRRLAVDIGERNVSHPGALGRAATYIEENWRDQGYTVGRQAYDGHGVDGANLEVEVRGAGSQEILLVGAHYDSVLGSLGANDNGSGVAALLELSRHFATAEPERTIRFVAFVNEESPYFFTPQFLYPAAG